MLESSATERTMVPDELLHRLDEDTALVIGTIEVDGDGSVQEAGVDGALPASRENPPSRYAEFCTDSHTESGMQRFAGQKNRCRTTNGYQSGLCVTALREKK